MIIQKHKVEHEMLAKKICVQLFGVGHRRESGVEEVKLN